MTTFGPLAAQWRFEMGDGAGATPSREFCNFFCSGRAAAELICWDGGKPLSAEPRAREGREAQQPCQPTYPQEAVQWFWRLAGIGLDGETCSPQSLARWQIVAGSMDIGLL